MLIKINSSHLNLYQFIIWHGFYDGTNSLQSFSKYLG